MQISANVIRQVLEKTPFSLSKEWYRKSDDKHRERRVSPTVTKINNIF